MIINPNNRDINPRNWGGSMWTLLHHISYLSSPELTDIIMCLPYILPCRNCRIHANAYISSHKIIDNKVKYLIDFHNAVTARTVTGEVKTEAFDRDGLPNAITNVKKEINSRLKQKLRYSLQPYQTYEYDENNTWNCLYLIAVTYEGVRMNEYQTFYDAISDIFGYNLKFNDKDYDSRDTLFIAINRAHAKDARLNNYKIDTRKQLISNANDLWDKRSISCGGSCSATE